MMREASTAAAHRPHLLSAVRCFMTLWPRGVRCSGQLTVTAGVDRRDPAGTRRQTLPGQDGQPEREPEGRIGMGRCSRAKARGGRMPRPFGFLEVSTVANGGRPVPAPIVTRRLSHCRELEGIGTPVKRAVALASAPKGEKGRRARVVPCGSRTQERREAGHLAGQYIAAPDELTGRFPDLVVLSCGSTLQGRMFSRLLRWWLEFPRTGIMGTLLLWLAPAMGRSRYDSSHLLRSPEKWAAK